MKNIYQFIDELIIYEKEHGIEFDNKGFPTFKNTYFVDTLPKDIIPYEHRKEAKNFKETSLCFFSLDKILYRYLSIEKLDIIAENLKNYHSFVGFDLSIFLDMLYPFQEFFILANLVIDIYLILKGAKMIPNIRGDETNGWSYFYLFKNAPIACSSNIGCYEDKFSREMTIGTMDAFLKINSKAILIQYGLKILNKSNAITFADYLRKRKAENNGK